MAKFTFLGTQNCDPSWCDLFNSPLIQQELVNIKNNIGNNFTPQPSDIFKIFQTDLSSSKVIILGQDPYPQNGVATGRAFEVKNITHWNQLKNNTSLQNILKLLYKNHTNCHSISTIEIVRNDTNFISCILPPNQLFVNWENQGVLLLNTALTCILDDPNSHKGHWKVFIEETIKFIDANTQGVAWFLWGKEAKAFCHLISNGIKYCSTHPRDNKIISGTFYYENHFSKVTSITWI